MTLADIATQLAEPFSLDDIDFLPKGKVEREGKTLCMALPYADPRVYQDRLNAIAYGEWSTPAPVVIVAGNKLICYVTVILYGIPHTDVGEAMNNEENTGTEAWAQAFKRACSQFGLGRYLYNLEKEWVPFDLKGKRIDLDKAGKQAIVRKMYQKAGIPVGNSKASAPKPMSVQPQVKPSDVEEVKSYVGSVFSFKQENYEARWGGYKVHVLNRAVADPDLTLADLAQLREYATKENEKKQAAASASGK